MKKFILKRLLLSVMILFFVSFIIYVLMRCMPTDFVEALAYKKASGASTKTFEEWLTKAPTAHSMVERIGREFVLGGHKAAAIGMVLENAEGSLLNSSPGTPFTSP